MPAEQPLGIQRLSEFLRSIERRLDHALDIAVRGRQRTRVYAEPPRDRGADLHLVEDFTLDLTGFEHVRSQGFEDGLLLKGKAKGLHPANKAPLPMPASR